MTTSELAPPEPRSARAFDRDLRRLYVARFVFAVAWAALLLTTSAGTGMLLAVLLVAYPLVDAAAVGWQLRSASPDRGQRVAERANVAVSVVVAVALGWASTVSVAAVLGIWGAWAVAAGVPQLVAAWRTRRSGGQVPQILSGGISVLAGVSFAAMAARGADDLSGIAGYAVLGGIFFVISAIRLGVLLRRTAG